MSMLVMTVMMTTLVIGPFYLSKALGLDATLVGIVMSVGPLVVVLSGVPTGRLADRYGAQYIFIGGLICMAVGSSMLSMFPSAFGIPGYIGPIIILTFGFALFQTANNTAVMKGVSSDERGVVSGMLNLSRNLGLVTGASVMGAIFALASGTHDIVAASPEALAHGMRITFTVAAALAGIALTIPITSSGLLTK